MDHYKGIISCSSFSWLLVVIATSVVLCVATTPVCLCALPATPQLFTPGLLRSSFKYTWFPCSHRQIVLRPSVVDIRTWLQFSPLTSRYFSVEISYPTFFSSCPHSWSAPNKPFHNSNSSPVSVFCSWFQQLSNPNTCQIKQAPGPWKLTFCRLNNNQILMYPL